MLTKELLKIAAKLQRVELLSIDVGIQRNTLQHIPLNSSQIIVISGIRRCGKSTLLHQIAECVKNFYYFNFDDPRIIGFDIKDFQTLDTVFHEEFGDAEYYFFDEVQNVPQWELFIRFLFEKKKKVFITGSNASLLSRELGTRLTGRHIRYELFPFSFKEFLLFKKKAPAESMISEYITTGGFPEYLREKNILYFRDLLESILARDIVVRHEIRNVDVLKKLAVYLITNVGKEFSYHSLKKMFGVGSTNTIISFLSFFEESYLFFTLPRFDFSYTKQIIGKKKVYCIDTGLVSATSASFSEDKGRLLENTVFLELRRNHSDIFYFQGDRECDFLVKEKGVIGAFQVCDSLTEENKDREIFGLVEALKKTNLSEGIILTRSQTDNFTIEHKNIHVLPVWKWLLQNKI